MSAPIASGVNPLRGTASSSSKDVEGYEPKYTTEVVDGHGLSDRRLNRRNFASSIQRLPSSDTSVDISIDFSANADEFTKEEPTDEPVGPSFDLGPAPSPRPSPRPHPPAAPSHARFNTHLELRSTDHTLPLLPDLRSSSVPQVTFDLSVGQSRKRKHESADDNQPQETHSLRVIETNPDGNCWFYSTLIATVGNGMQYDRFRQEVVDHIERNVGSFSGHFSPREGYLFSDHIETLRRDREWADHIIIQATANVLNRVIHIHHEHIGGRLITVHPMTELVPPVLIRQEPISVLYSNRVIHYDAIVSNERFEVSFIYYQLNAALPFTYKVYFSKSKKGTK